MTLRFAPIVVLAAIAIAAGCGGSDAESGTPLKPIESNGPRGSIDLVQEGEQVSGTIRLAGLEPGSAHAAHLHGEVDGQFSCAGERTMAHLVNFPDLVADDDGVAEIRLDFTAPADTLRAGTYVMAHENPRTVGEIATDARVMAPGMMTMDRAENPPIACGDITGE